MDKTNIAAIAAIICIAIIEICAIFAGLNGYLLALAIGSMAGLGGYFGARKKYK